MKRIRQYSYSAMIPSNAKFLFCNQDPSLGSNRIEDLTFVYEVPEPPKSSPKSDEKEKGALATIERVIKYLNSKTGGKYTAKSKAHSSKIRARLNEGYKPEDFKTVIDNMCTQWLDDPKWSKFLRPDTLFSNKFSGYLSHKSGESMTQDAFNELDKILEGANA